MQLRPFPLTETECVRTLLRARTMPLHQRLEAMVEGAGYFDDRHGYVEWLRMMAQIHLRFATDYDIGAQNLGLCPASAFLLDALASDLGDALPLPPPPSLNARQSIGVAYVFEGSAMGARLIERRLAGLPDAPTCYLDSLVSTSRKRWPQTKAALASLRADPKPIIAGANEVFGALLAAAEENRT